MTRAGAASEATETKPLEWIVYQIGSSDRDKFRFVVTEGFDDEGVEAQLRADEFIDTTATLAGALGGDVTVLHPAADRLRALVEHVAPLLEPPPDSQTMRQFTALGLYQLGGLVHDARAVLAETPAR